MHRADAFDAVLELAVAALRTQLGADPREAVADVLLRALDADVIGFDRVRPSPRTAGVAVVEGPWAESLAPSREGVPGLNERLAVPVQAPIGERRAWVALRASCPFDNPTLRAAARVQPVLSAVEAQREVLLRLTGRSEVHPLAGVGGGLTAREQAVLVLLSDGLTAASIGHRLAMSPRTVTTHLQKIYRKLEVCDRLSAVLRARDLGLLPVSASGWGHRSRLGPVAAAPSVGDQRSPAAGPERRRDGGGGVEPEYRGDRRRLAPGRTLVTW